MERLTAEDTKAILIAALVELFERRGVDAISVRDVAARAGVNHGLVHRHFGSKAGLIEAAVRQISAEIHAGTPDRPGMSAPSFEYLRHNPAIPRMVARACLEGPADLLAAAAPTPRRLEEIVAPVRAALARLGRPAVDPYLLNAAATAMLLGWFVFKPLLERGFGIPADADDQLAALLALLDAFIVGGR